MEHRQRVRREDPERTAPRRDWYQAFGQGSQQTDTDGASSGADGMFGDWQSVIEQGVRMGYDVIDSQIREGRKVAEQVAGRMPGAASSTDSARTLRDGIVGSYVDLSSRWLDLMSGMARSTGATPTSGGAAAAQGSGGPPAAMSIVVDSKLPLKISLDLPSEVTDRDLASHPLCDPDPQKPLLRDITLTPARGTTPVTIGIRVPVDQPSGTYAGVIYDRANGHPLGTLTLTLSSESRAQDSAAA